MTPLFKWSDDYNTGIPDIDRDHRSLFALINDLHTRTEGSPDSSIKSTLQALLEHVSSHFDREEALMESCKFPDLENHKTEHRILRARLETYQRQHEQNPQAFDVLDFEGFLTSWIKDHILQSDMAYVPCVQQRVANIVEFPSVK